MLLYRTAVMCKNYKIIMANCEGNGHTAKADTINIVGYIIHDIFY